MKRSLAATVLASTLSLAGAAYGQAPTEAPKLALGVALGGITSMNPNLGVRPIQWIASARCGVTPHFAIEPEFGRWSYGKDVAWAGTGSVKESIAWTFAGANALARFPVSRAAVFVGAGAGLYYYHRQDTGTMFGAPYHYEWDGSALGLQALGGVDVHVARQVSVFGVWRAQGVPEAELGTMSLLAGIRYAF